MKSGFAVHWSFAAIIILTAQPNAGQQPKSDVGPVSEAGSLALHKPVSRELGPGKTDRFTFRAAAGQFLRIVITKKGVNVITSLLGPDGTTLMTADDPPYRTLGVESLSTITQTEGEYQIVVTKSPSTAETGSYTVEWEMQESPSDMDRARLEAESQFYASVRDERAEDKDHKLQALAGYQRAADLWQSLHDSDQAALSLHRAAVVHHTLGDLKQAAGILQQAVQLWRAANDASGEAMSLVVLGFIKTQSGDQQNAQGYYTQALSLNRSDGDREGEALVLQIIGNSRYFGGDSQQALTYYRQALELRRELHDELNEASLLSSMGTSYQELGENDEALSCFREALPLSRKIHSRDIEAATLTNLGIVYRELGSEQESLQYFHDAIPLFQTLGERNGESLAFYGLGESLVWLNRLDEALDCGNKSLALAREIGDRRDEALALSLLSFAYSHLGQWQKALDRDNEALPIARSVEDRTEETWTLIAMGDHQARLGQSGSALESYQKALQLARADANLTQQYVVFGSLMQYERDAHQSELAIFFGKQAVNCLQQMRNRLQSFDKDVQSRFVSSNESHYRDLADLLIGEGRLPEAQQVLDLLKEQEYTDYIRGDRARPLGPLSLTPAEQQADDDYKKSTAQIVTLGEQWSQLKEIATRTPAQEQKFKEISADLARANQSLNDYFVRTYRLLGGDRGANRQIADVKGDAAVLREVIARTPHAVALYTMVAKDGYHVIVITSSIMVARSYAINEAELNQKIATLQQLLRDPKTDPRPLEEDLYRVLIGPVKADLDQVHAQMLIWSLDGILRYIPMGALYDGSRYLVENYSMVSVTPASVTHLEDRPQMDGIRALAMGISRKYENNLNALPAVVSELDDVVRDPQVEGANGVLPGTILLDRKFTESAMEKSLEGGHSVVHIASHFVFKPGDDNASYLLLAGKDTDSSGYHLTVADFRNNQNLSLDGTDLLTLSACETGVGSDARDGREVDGLSMTAQLKGANAVMSSLWDVNDASTGQLMADFYKRWAEGKGLVTKAEALRQAQLDLLTGTIKPTSDLSNPNAPINFAHPYYWAPFVLTGNWE